MLNFVERKQHSEWLTAATEVSGAVVSLLRVQHMSRDLMILLRAVLNESSH